MTDRRPEAVCIGECMIELARKPGGSFHLAFGGDTFNTAVYLSRAGIHTAYATALGDDTYSAMIGDLVRAEGIDTGLISIRPGRVPGLYLIETDDTGERSFSYWRDTSPARELFDAPPPALLDAMTGARLVYLSGITLWLFGEKGRANLFRAVDAARAAGARIAFDGNFRPRLWGHDRESARSAFEAMLRRTDIALPTFDDERDLWRDAGPEATLSRCSALGATEIVVKSGPAGALVWTNGQTAHVPIPAKVEPLDTTAAGDSFNAGYLAARLSGQSPADAALAGHHVAAVVIAHAGAIVPQKAMRNVMPIRPAEARAPYAQGR